MRSLKLFLLLSFLGLGLSGCGVQSIPQGKNQVEAALAEITNQYKRRSDLIPNLVNTVKGYAAHESKTLEAVTEARAKATSVTISADNLDEATLKKYQAAQGSLSQALGRLLAVSENYPQLKADRNFQDLQSQIEGTENRITVARQRYIESIKEFNDLVTVPPTSWTNGLFFHYSKMPQFTVDAAENVEKAPEVKF